MKISEKLQNASRVLEILNAQLKQQRQLLDLAKKGLLVSVENLDGEEDILAEESLERRIARLLASIEHYEKIIIEAA